MKSKGEMMSSGYDQTAITNSGTASAKYIGDDEGTHFTKTFNKRGSSYASAANSKG
jgi:hypothetical protein